MKGQTSLLPAVIIALVIPLVVTILFVVQAGISNATEGVFTIAITDEVLAAGLNATAISLGNNYIYDDEGLTFNATGLTEDVNYTVDYTAGTITWNSYMVDSPENSSDYAIDYEYFLDGHKTTFDDLQSNTNDSYDMAGILPIALIGIAILIAILGAIGGIVILRR